MKLPLALLKIIGKAVLNAVGGGFAGDLFVDVLPDAAQEVWKWWRKDLTPEERREEVEALARAPAADVQAAVQQVVAEVAGDRPKDVQIALSLYLSQVPNAERRSLPTPADPAGVSRPLLPLDEADDLLPLLPAHLPRFRAGDRPLPGIDWELEELLGAGGFGEVWKAKNPHFDAVPPVALKFCLDPAAKDRLLRHEAAVLNQVLRQGKHPGVVALRHTYLGADPPCLEYEYVAGGDLAGLIREWRRKPGGPGRAAEAARLLLDLAHIVAFAHRLDPPIVHRDLKPANVLVQPAADGSPTLRVADFGIGGVAAGRALAPGRRDVSQGQFLVTALRGAHTPLYASPQQTRGGPPDPRDDVYSLGVIWYQLLTGNLTASRPGGARWVTRLTDDGASAGMVELLTACVEDDPADRPHDAGELADRLAAMLAPAPAPAEPRREFRRAPEAKPEPPRAITNSVGMKLVLIPAGSFLIGSPEGEMQRGADEGPLRRVTLTRPFYLSVFPVTQFIYAHVTGRNPSHFTPANGGGPNHPAEEVSWEDAVAFCRRLSALDGEKRAGRAYRLPTEAEWEYACRAGTTTAFAFGDSLSAEQANFDGNHPYGAAARGRHLQRTSAFGQYKPNAWGLYDMHGNVWEWCADWYAADYYATAADHDSGGPPRGEQRVLRGGSWNNSGHLCRSARRNKYAPGFRNDTIGFRVALAVPGG
jgi:formylglycine-generating enzyme required for sulfatase activity